MQICGPVPQQCLFTRSSVRIFPSLLLTTPPKAAYTDMAVSEVSKIQGWLCMQGQLLFPLLNIKIRGRHYVLAQYQGG